MVKNKAVKKGTKTYTDKILSRIWTNVGYSAIALTLVCLGFLLIKGIDAWSAMFMFALIIVPFAEIANGIVLKESSYIWGGNIGLLAGIFILSCMAANVPLHVTWVMPVFIAAFVCMMIIPGHIINYKAKQLQ